MDKETQISDPSLNVSVIGTGYWGKNLVRNFYRFGNLKLVCDKNEDSCAQIARDYPRLEVCLSINEVMARPDVHGVVVATPAETHFAIAREALLAGKHVFVEKPLVLREEEGEELIALAGERKLTLMVGHLLQYHPVFAHLKRLALSGELGRINYIYSHRLNLGKIRREENILWSFAPHDISMILALAEEDPESIVATGGNYLHSKIADVTTTHLDFPSGLKAHIFVSWLHPFKDQKLVVVGDRKMAVFDDTQPWNDKLLLYPHEIRWENHVPVAAKAEAERVDSIPPEEPLRLECQHFLNCIAQKNFPITDGREGLRVLRILNASQRSLDNNGGRIYLKEKEAKPGIPAGPSTSAPRTGDANGFYVHPTALVDENVSVGKGSKIWHFSHILSGSHVGEGCNVGQNVVIGPDVNVGNGCKIQNNVSVYKGVTLEEGVFCGPSMVFTNVYNPRAEIRKMSEIRNTTLKKGATIGANATIVCGHTIGRYAFIGAGSVVTKDVPDHALMVGNPARQIGWACKCGERLSIDLECLGCGKKYEKEDGKISELTP